jgi:hypothetical protein
VGEDCCRMDEEGGRIEAEEIGMDGGKNGCCR